MTLTNDYVIVTTYQGHPEILANRERLKTFQALAKAERAGFQQLAYGARAYNSSTRSQAGGAWETETNPTLEFFARKDLGKGRGAEVFGGTNYSFVHNDTHAPGGSFGIRGQLPISGSEDARSQSIRLLDRGSDTLIAEIAYFDSVRERLRKSTQSFLFARINRNHLAYIVTIKAELLLLQDIAQKRIDTDAIDKIDAALSANAAAYQELENSFGANLADIKQRAGIHPPKEVTVERGAIVVSLDRADQMTKYAIQNDPQIKSLDVSKQSLKEQYTIIASAWVDVLGFIEGKTSYATQPRAQNYNGIIGVVVSVPDSSLQKERLAVIEARTREVEVRIAGWIDDITLSVYQQHNLASTYGERIAAIEATLPLREKIYRDRLARYKRRDRVSFDDVLLALNEWQNDLILREAYNQHYAIVLAELWKYNGYYFQILEEANALSAKNE